MADRGRKALPSTNHLLTERWNTYTLDLHHKRLADIRGRCDHATPQTMKLPHLKHNLKKKYLDEMRNKEIHHENTLLVDKMEKIARTSTRSAPSSNGGKNSEPFLYRSTMQVRPGYRLNSYQVPIIDTRNEYHERSLNHDFRSKVLSEIGHQNQEMARRLMTITSSYDMGQLDLDFHAHEKYVVLRRNPEVIRLGKLLKTVDGMSKEWDTVADDHDTSGHHTGTAPPSLQASAHLTGTASALQETAHHTDAAEAGRRASNTEAKDATVAVEAGDASSAEAGEEKSADAAGEVKSAEASKEEAIEQDVGVDQADQKPGAQQESTEAAEEAEAVAEA